MSAGQRQEQSGRLAHSSLCLSVWDYSSKFTQSASDWQAAEESEVTVRGDTALHKHDVLGCRWLRREGEKKR